MKTYLNLFLILLLTSCVEKKTASTEITKINNLNESRQNNEVANTDEYATYYVIVTDTSFDYNILKSKMLKLNQLLKIPIDTMGRYFNKKKNLIALPDNDKDQMYAGNYYPRRDPSENLSLEYLHFYQKKARDKTIALVAGIYEREKSGDSALTILARAKIKGFKIKSKIFIGCMH
ncbi:MAG: hypothetical protein H7Z76_05085 [Methylotenera sp.]|nr:hypothetical protein [Flavobacterium sp.]